MARQALHAWRVTFSQPVSNAPVVVTAPFPPDLAARLERVGVDDMIAPSPA